VKLRDVVTTGLMLALVATGCSHATSGSPLPSGITDIGGPPVTSAPPPPPDWSPEDVAPQSQQQAQDTVLASLRRTLQALPPGTVLDGSRYASAGHNSFCEDSPADPDNAPVRFHTIGDLTLPTGITAAQAIQVVGDTWRSWGWYVLHRDGFPAPNQFGYAPDGYRIQITAANQPPDGPPTVQASSPCFPKSVARDDIAIPAVVTAAG